VALLLTLVSVAALIIKKVIERRTKTS
jgi:hypothetical protein